jgi:O-antigen ligase
MRSRDRLTMIAGLIALAIGVLGAGGGVRWVVVALALFAALTAATQVRSRRKLATPSALLILLSVLMGLTALQLVPLPPSLTSWLQETPRELVADGERLLGDTPSWGPLSLDPAATLLELAKFGAYWLVAWMALRAAVTERGRQRLLSGVAGIAGVVALSAVIHEILGASTLFGVYTPSHANPIVMAPLLNANHLACLMAMGALIAGGLALHEHRAPPVRVLWILVAILCIGVGLATRSRGGVIALAGGATVLAGIIVLQRLREAGQSKRRDVLRVVLPAAVVVMCTLVLALYLGGGEVRDDLESTQLDELDDPRSKYAAWRSSLSLVEEAPLFGIGRGAFETVFTRVHPASSHVTFSHVENEYLQTVIDWGVLGTIAIAACVGFALLVVVRRWREGVLTATAIAGLTAVALQSLVDFGLEIPGVALPVVIVAATLLHVPLEETSRSVRRIASRLSIIVVVVLAAVLAATPLATSLAEDHRAIRDATSASTARAAFRRHPLDYLAAAHVARTSTEPAVRSAFLNHALRLHPSHPGLHRTVARWLLANGRIEQAKLELRISLLGSRQPEQLVGEIVTLLKRPEDAAAALPPDHPLWGRIVTTLLELKREDIALLYLVSMVEAQPGRPPEVYRRMLAIAEKRKELEIAERAATGLARVEPTPSATVSLARIQVTRKNYDVASVTLAALIKDNVTSTDHVEAHLLVCEIAIAKTEWKPALDCLDRTIAQPAVTAKLRQRIHSRLAVVSDALGDKLRAQLERKLAGE